mmetsp:Transcript_22324/g.49400  ORF Transcript_22324/g.49400 Transcript_22324/m.49400 type:complete len:512 (-) Transcript_22324:6-1541(-)
MANAFDENRVAANPASVEIRAGTEDKVLGLSFDSMPPGTPEVVHIKPGFWAERAGVRKGFVVMEVNGLPVDLMDAQTFSAHLHDRPLRMVMGLSARESEEEYENGDSRYEVMAHATGETPGPGVRRRRPLVRRGPLHQHRTQTGAALKVDESPSMWGTVSSSLSWIVSEGSKIASSYSAPEGQPLREHEEQPRRAMSQERRFSREPTGRRSSSRGGLRATTPAAEAAGRAADAAVLAAEAAAKAAHLANENSQLREELAAMRAKESRQAEATALLQMELNIMRSALQNLELGGNDSVMLADAMKDAIRSERRVLKEELATEGSGARRLMLQKTLEKADPADLSWIQCKSGSSGRARGMSAELQEKLEQRRSVVDEMRGYRSARGVRDGKRGSAPDTRQGVERRDSCDWYYQGSSDEETRRSLNLGTPGSRASVSSKRSSFAMVDNARLSLLQSNTSQSRKPTVIDLIDWGECNADALQAGVVEGSMGGRRGTPSTQSPNEFVPVSPTESVQ